MSFPGGVFSDFEMQQPTEAETALRNNPNRGPTSPEDYGHRIVNLTDGNMPVGRDRFVVLYGFDLLVAGSIVGYDGLCVLRVRPECELSFDASFSRPDGKTLPPYAAFRVPLSKMDGREGALERACRCELTGSYNTNGAHGQRYTVPTWSNSLFCYYDKGILRMAFSRSIRTDLNQILGPIAAAFAKSAISIFQGLTTEREGTSSAYRV